MSVAQRNDLMQQSHSIPGSAVTPTHHFVDYWSRITQGSCGWSIHIITYTGSTISRNINAHNTPKIIHQIRLDSTTTCKKKPLLSVKNRKDRLAFCHKFKQWTAEDWSKVLFSDETTVRLFSNVGAQMVRRPKGARYNPRYCQPIVKLSLSVIMWGSMSATGRGNLWFLPPKNHNDSCQLPWGADGANAVNDDRSSNLSSCMMAPRAIKQSWWKSGWPQRK